MFQLQYGAFSFSSPRAQQTVEVLIHVFELSVCNFEIYDEMCLITVLTSLLLTIIMINDSEVALRCLETREK